MKDRILNEIKTAMKAKQKETVAVLRNLQAAIKQIEIDSQKELDEAGVLAVLQKQIKQRQESLKIYQENAREDLAAKEQAELTVLESFMPEQLSEDELLELVQQTVTQLAATGMQDMGKVMGALKEKAAGKANPADISRLVKQALSK